LFSVRNAFLIEIKVGRININGPVQQWPNIGHKVTRPICSSSYLSIKETRQSKQLKVGKGYDAKTFSRNFNHNIKHTFCLAIFFTSSLISMPVFIYVVVKYNQNHLQHLHLIY